MAFRRVIPLVVTLVLAACGGSSVSPTTQLEPSPASVVAAASPSGTPTAASVQPAPGSDSRVYPANPSQIVVAIDPGHGGCLDWGVPDPSERGEELAEKTLTLAIAERLRDLLVADDISVVMLREGDEALAGDQYEPLDCDGPAWRDVNGDGVSGFGPDVSEGTRTRDELQARLDLANVVAADALVSIHINSPFDDGNPVEIAFTQTFYTDETPWGPTLGAALADAVQSGVVAHLGDIAEYERGDRGTAAQNFYLVAPPLFEVTPERDDRLKQPTRGGLMPVVLSEVGSITLRAEHDLLASDRGQDAVAAGLFDGLAAFFTDREIAARIALADAEPGERPDPVPGDGPPYWPPTVADGPVEVRLTNTGTRAWPSETRLVAGWSETDEPYLARPPDDMSPLPAVIPALRPGESTTVVIELPPPPTGPRSVAWISLLVDGATAADRGSPALQLSGGAP